MTGRAAGNLLTRTTAILATAFMVTSLVLAVLANTRSAPPSVLDQPLPLTAPAPVGGGNRLRRPATPRRRPRHLWRVSAGSIIWAGRRSPGPFP